MQDIIQQNIGAKITYTGAGLSTGSGVWGWLAENHHALASLGVLVGIAVAVTGLAIQIRATRRNDQRAEEVHRKRMADLKARDGQ